jgi:hypothetical protein
MWLGIFGNLSIIWWSGHCRLGAIYLVFGDHQIEEEVNDYNR